MSIPFSRSMRSLNVDNLRPSFMGLIIALVLLVAWIVWFFLAQITIYETGQIVGLTKDGSIIANFSPEALGHIQSGQSALLWLNAITDDQVGPIPAIVIDVTNNTQEDQGQVEIFALPDANYQLSIQDGLTGQVNVQVKQVSPATLVMQACGQRLDTAPVSLDLQERLD